MTDPSQIAGLRMQAGKLGHTEKIDEGTHPLEAFVDGNVRAFIGTDPTIKGVNDEPNLCTQSNTIPCLSNSVIGSVVKALHCIFTDSTPEDLVHDADTGEQGL